MKRFVILSVVCVLAVAVGFFVGRRQPEASIGSDGPSLTWNAATGSSSDTSPLLLEAYYFKAASSIELRFIANAPVIDGIPYGGSDLAGELRKKREDSKARFLVIVCEDQDQFGPMIERVSSLRTLGFKRVVIMGTKT